jgi:histidine ammonia-lyase
MVQLARLVVATELVVAAQAVELRGSEPLGDGTREILAAVRERYPFLEDGDLSANDLDPVVELVRSGRL